MGFQFVFGICIVLSHRKIFLGDRVLGLVMAKKLLEIYPNEKVWQISTVRPSIIGIRAQRMKQLSNIFHLVTN